jgi:peptidylprolyl isomerase
MMSKAERRAAGKVAARKRAAARRRKKALQNVAVALAGIGVVVVLVIIFGGFGSDPEPQASTPSATAGADGPATPDPAPAPTVPDDFDEALRTKPAVTKGEGDVTELKVTTIVEGAGPAVQLGQTLSVNYVGVTHVDGTQFDSSWDRGQPATFMLAEGQLIEGWVKGLPGVKVGSRVQIDIPAEMAYGEDGANGPPGDLRFVVDILSAA